MTPTRRVVLLAHGSPDPRHARDTARLATAVGALLPGVRVVAAYLDHDRPRVVDVIAPGPPLPTTVVPLLLSDAHHAGSDVPAAVAATRRAVPGAPISRRRPIGPHPGLLAAIEEAVGERPSPRTGLVVVGAGSARARAREATARLVRRLTARGWGAAQVAFASGPGPTVGHAVAALRGHDLTRGADRPGGVDRVVVAPLLIADGVLADRIRDRAAGAGADRVAGVLAGTEALARLVADRAGRGYQDARASDSSAARRPASMSASVREKSSTDRSR